ncbi:class I SAM-dependent methyltransferase [Candidatus Woesearchaeota archaeon]|nr:class I SAM-dependent methyltransferase [Candidatus Woesearchaeota archaeon]
MGVYNKPLYYEIAFSFVDAKKQVDLFEKFIEKYSKIKVKRVLDIACGPSLQLRELAKRDYEVIGLDLSLPMLKYLQEKAKEEGVRIDTVKANMTNFKLKKKVDFAFIMMGSFRFKNNEDLLKHLDCVSNSLKNGSLYLIENMELDWLSFKPQSWIMKRDGIEIKTTYKLKQKDPIFQTSEEIISLEVNDNGKKLKFVEKRIMKHIYLQEFLALVKLNNKFEFLGQFERFKFKKLKKGCMDNIILLRKK